jgi:hypothetical protein
MLRWLEGLAFAAALAMADAIYYLRCARDRALAWLRRHLRRAA